MEKKGRGGRAQGSEGWESTDNGGKWWETMGKDRTGG